MGWNGMEEQVGVRGICLTGGRVQPQPQPITPLQSQQHHPTSTNQHYRKRVLFID